MAAYVERTRTVTRFEWALRGAEPGSHGVMLGEMLRAIAAAQNRYESVTGKPATYDDCIRAYACDDEIVLSFEAQEVIEGV
ncbi:hypothetical protein [Nocardia sp. NPDC004711]